MNTRTAKRLRVETEESSLRVLRGMAGKHGMNDRLAYGLAMEFAAQSKDDFERFVREKEQDPQE